MRRYVAVRAAESSRIEPQGSTGGAPQPPVGNSIWVNVKSGIQVSTEDAKRKAGTQRHNTAGLPAAEQCLGDAVGAFKERDVIHKVDHRPMGDIEPVAPSIASSVFGVLIRGVPFSPRTL